MARGFETITTGQLVTTATINDKFIKQGVIYFADATARDAAITSPEEGMHAYLADTNELTWYDGSSWNVLSDRFALRSTLTTKGDIYVATASGTLARLGVGADGQALVADSAEAKGVKWASTSTDRAVLAGFGARISDIVTATQLYRAIGNGTTPVSQQLPLVVDRAGSIVGLSVGLTSARTGGSVTFEVYKNGSATGLTVTINGTNTQYHSAVQAGALDTFVAGDRIDVRATNSSFTPSGGSSPYCEAAVTVQYD